jgi:hypothetical protein
MVQTSLNQFDYNVPYGNIINETKRNNTIRILYQNIRGAKVNKNWDNWNHGYNWIKDKNIDITLLTETNTNWNAFNKQQALINIKKKLDKHN